MNNLKRVLSLVMSGAMLVGMLTIGASAANTTFSDKDEITHTEAVNTMAALGVIKGRDNGQYDPAGNVSRAEMAKIICVMLNGGEEPAWGTGVQTTFTDTQKHWAKNYIAYCANKGIIAGLGDGTFSPDGLVTGAQAAKMMLVALDYDPDIFKLVGLKWEDNTNDIAASKGLYKDIKGLNTSAPLSRDDAAQMAYNCLDAKPMVKSFESVAANGEITYKYNEGEQKFLAKYFEATTFVGTFKGNKETGADGCNKDGMILVVGGIEGTDETSVKATFYSDMDISLIGEEVKVIYSEVKGGNDKGPDTGDDIYGAYPTGETEVLNVLKADVDEVEDKAGKVEIDGTKYDLATVVTVNHNYTDDDPIGTAAEGDSPATPAKYSDLEAKLDTDKSSDTIKFVLNSDGEVESAYVVNYSMGKVTGVNSTKVTVSGLGAVEFKDNDVEEGLKVDDLVVWNAIYAAASKKNDAFITIAKAESVNGKVEGYKTDKNNATKVTQVTLDGTTYKTVDGLSEDSNLADEPATTTKIGDEYTLYLINGKAFLAVSEEEDDSTYALVVGKSVTDTNEAKFTEGKVKIMTTDGTKTTYVVHEDSKVQPTDISAVGALVKYSISNNQIKIKEVISDKSKSAALWDSDTKQVAGVGTASSDCVLFTTTAKVGGDGGDAENGTDWKVYKIRDLDDLSTEATYTYVANGSGRVTIVVADLKDEPNGASSDTVYGMITGYTNTVKLGDDEYRQYKVWTADGEKTINIEVTDDEGNSVLKNGTYVTYDETNNDRYAFGKVNAVEGTNVAVKDYSTSDKVLSYYSKLTANESGEGENKVTTYSGEKENLTSVAMDKDGVIVYVDAEENDGVDDMGISSFDTSTGFANAKIVLKDSKIIALFVNTNTDVDVDGKTDAPLTGE